MTNKPNKKNETMVKRRANGQFENGNHPATEFKKDNQAAVGAEHYRTFEADWEEHTGLGTDYAIKKLKQAIDDDDWRAVQYILDRLYGKIPDMTIIVQKIEVDVVHRIGAMLPQAMLQAGVPKKQAKEAIQNFTRLLEAGE